MPLYWDERTGSLWMEINKFDTELLYSTGLTAGLGSNDIGLDRGQSGQGRVVKFQRIGPRVLMVQPNYTFRANTTNPDERRAVEDAFAKSILWGFTVAAENDGRVLVDATDFFLRDAVNVIPRLRPGNFRVDRTRSAIDMPWTKVFPKNTEVDTIMTFANDGAAGGGRGGGGGPAQGPPQVSGPVPQGGGFGGGMFSGTVASVTPTADAVTLREHHTFAELPDSNYKPRFDDPRAGYGGLQYVDYAAPLGTPMVQRFVRRHRLEKVDPSARVSDAKKPIVYYVDRGTPEPIRTALLQGASWWNQAFEAAGYRNAFRVELLPEGADPMDIRYNMINWVHRSTRGWSTGATISDPRTGEIIKATVTLGSLRDRQDYLIFESLLAPYKTGTETPAILQQTAIARIRQLAAHEVGHTLGLGHEYYNSTKGRISVMDYPHPLEKLNADGTIDLSDAYAVGIGEWDKVAITYGYQDFPAGTDEPAALRKILDDAWKQDLVYMTNQDTDISPQVGPVEQRHRHGGRAEPDHEGAARRAEPVRRNGDQEGRADGDDGRGAGAALHVSPLRGRSRGVGRRRTGLRLRFPRRRPHPDQVGLERAAARGDRGAGLDALAVGAGAAEERAREDSAAPVGLGRPSRALRPLHRRCLRPDQPGLDRRGRDDRVHAAARSRGADGRAARRSTRRCPGLSDVIESLRKATFGAAAATPYEAGNPPRHVARAGRTADLARRRRADAAGPRDRVERADADSDRGRPSGPQPPARMPWRQA